MKPTTIDKVRGIYPGARAVRTFALFQGMSIYHTRIWPTSNIKETRCVGSGLTEVAAWADALRRIRRKELVEV